MPVPIDDSEPPPSSHAYPRPVAADARAEEKKKWARLLRQLIAFALPRTKGDASLAADTASTAILSLLHPETSSWDPDKPVAAHLESKELLYHLGRKIRDQLEDAGKTDQSALARELDAIVALSRDELDQRLDQGGIDAKHVEEAGDALLQLAEGGSLPAPANEPASASPQSESAPSAPSPRRRRSPAATLATVAVALLLVAGAAALFWPSLLPTALYPANNPPSPPASSQVSADEVATIRRDAFDACGNSLWKQCLHKLDEARDLDPVGEGAPLVVEARARAMKALAEAAHSPPAVPPTEAGP